MTLSLILACVWGLAATVAAMVPSRDDHWTRAYVLIAVGVPILLAVFWQHGPVIGGLVLAGGLSVLRWPVIYLGRWLRRKLGPDGAR
ncbi:hypothetical protein ATO6_16270 [Oceanicola sp. 22II-s10i]|uniref:DUF2484 family protein n=1 Tax=Oceanicola sp. 22II-s10i TaxID=1317116 RepID=UPI000B526E8A|nr:DUF2484 family protein [Oceanicola sp. 22II-s10i]OWU83961.1 hypothetical protein ATO6_16270 [Oceanicola sp. 22II-s10i]